MYKDYFHPENKLWVADRKAEWRPVKKNLGAMNIVVARKTHRFHQTFFFSGEQDPLLSDRRECMRQDIPNPYGSYLAFFKMWYHPEPSSDTFKEVFEEGVENSLSLSKSRNLLFNLDADLFTTDYGMCGGREELMVKTFFFGVDHRVEVIDGYAQCYPPKSMFTKCVNHTLSLLLRSNVNQYAPGRYLWDHLSYIFEEYHELFLDSYYTEILHKVSRLILNFHEREDGPKDREVVAEFRGQLMARFEARDFTPKLMAIWDQEKAAYEAGE